jgi:hypothetical protein
MNNNVTGHISCENSALCLKRTFKDLKTINTINLRLTEEELLYLNYDDNENKDKEKIDNENKDKEKIDNENKDKENNTKLNNTKLN